MPAAHGGRWGQGGVGGKGRQVGPARGRGGEEAWQEGGSEEAGTMPSR